MAAHNAQSTQGESQLYIFVCWSRLLEPTLISYLIHDCSAVPAIRSPVCSLVHLYNPKMLVVTFDDLKGQRNTKSQYCKSPYNSQKISWLTYGQITEARKCYPQAFGFKLIPVIHVLVHRLLWSMFLSFGKRHQTKPECFIKPNSPLQKDVQGLHYFTSCLICF